MEGVGARLGRSSTRYGPATVFTGPVRKWKKRWVPLAAPIGPSNLHHHNHHSAFSSPPNGSQSYSNGNITSNGNPSSHLLLYKWTPLAPNSANNINKDTASPIKSGGKNKDHDATTDEPPKRKFKYMPVCLFEKESADKEVMIIDQGDGDLASADKPDMKNENLASSEKPDDINGDLASLEKPDDEKVVLPSAEKPDEQKGVLPSAEEPDEQKDILSYAEEPDINMGDSAFNEKQDINMGDLANNEKQHINNGDSESAETPDTKNGDLDSSQKPDISHGALTSTEKPDFNNLTGEKTGDDSGLRQDLNLSVHEGDSNTVTPEA